MYDTRNLATAAIAGLLAATLTLGCAGEDLGSEAPPDDKADAGALPTADATTALTADGGPKGQTDAGRPDRGPAPDGRQPAGPSCENGEGCPADTVCAPVGFCVPDCRVEAQACPDHLAACDETTGLCERDPSADGGPPSCDGPDDCADNQVCAPSGSCVPDCRLSAQCPEQRPVCDESTGLCSP